MTENRKYKVSRIFTGYEWQQIEGDDNNIIVPAFIDLQIYGAYGRLLAVHPDVTSLEAIVEWSRKGGAAWSMPTVATNTKEVFFRSIDAVKAYWKNKGPGVLGLHLEGPWINEVK